MVDPLEEALARAEAEGKLLVVRVVGDGEPRTIGEFLADPLERAFVARHVVLLAVDAHAARPLGDWLHAGTVAAFHAGRRQACNKTDDDALAGTRRYEWLWQARSLSRLFDVDVRGVASELCSEAERLTAARDYPRAAETCVRALRASSGRRVFRPHGAPEPADSRLVALTRAAPELAVALETHVADLRARLADGSADAIDVGTWGALHRVLGAEDRLAEAVVALRLSQTPRVVVTFTAVVAHRAIAAAGRWTDLLELYPEPVEHVRECVARLPALGELRSKSGSGPMPTNAQMRAVLAPTHDLYGALLVAGREAEADEIARTLREAMQTAANHLGLVEAGLRAQQRRPEFPAWLELAARQGDRSEVDEAKRLWAAFDALPD